MRQLFFSLCCILLVAPGVFAAPKVPDASITITTGEFPPFNSESFKNYGLIPAIISEAFASEGIDVKFVFTSWIRAYKLSSQGEVEGTAHWYDSEERRKEHYYSDPMFEERLVWFHLRGNPLQWDKLSDLKGIKIAAISGFTYSKEFYQAINKGLLNVVFVNRLQQSFDLILAGRADATLESVDVGYYGLRKWHPPHTVDLFTNHPKPAMTVLNYLLISKKSPNGPMLIKKFNRGLATLKRHGRINELILMSRTGKFDQKK